MSIKRNASNWRAKRWAVTITVTAVAFFALVLLLANPIVEKKIDRALQKNLGENLSYSKLNSNLFKGSIRLRDVQVSIPKDSISQQNLLIKELRLSGLNTLPLLLKKRKLRIKTVELKNPDVTIFKGQRVNPEETQSLDLFDLIKNEFDHLHIHSFKVSNATVKLMKPGGEQPIQAITDLYINISNIQLDSVISKTHSGWFGMNSIDVEAGEFFSTPDHSLHRLQASSISASSTNSTVIISEVKNIPLIEKTTLSSKAGYQTDWMPITITDLTFTGFSIPDFIYSSTIKADLLTINEVDFETYRDKRVAEKSGHSPGLLHLRFANWDQKVDIEKLELKNSRFRYEELSTNSDKTGEVFFSNAYATIHNLSNVSEKLHSGLITQVNVQADLMGKSKLAVEMDLPLNSSTGNHRVKGSLRPFSFSDLNTAFTPLESIKVETGRIQSMDFEFTADLNKSEGTMRMLYDDLKLSIENPESEKSFGLFKDILSLAANAFVIKSSNPRKNGEIEEAVISFERDLGKSTFNYWWKSVFSGMMNSIKGSDTLETDDEIAEAELTKKEQRQIRREERKAEKEEQKADKPGLIKRIFGGKKEKSEPD